MWTHVKRRDDAHQLNFLPPVRALATLWILISPWVLFVTAVAEPSVPAAISHLVVGMVMMVFAVAPTTSPNASETWVDFAGGMWLAVSPWWLGYGDNWSLVLNSVVSGVVVIGLSGWEIADRRRNVRQG